MEGRETVLLNSTPSQRYSSDRNSRRGDGTERDEVGSAGATYHRLTREKGG